MKKNLKNNCNGFPVKGDTFTNLSTEAPKLTISSLNAFYNAIMSGPEPTHMLAHKAGKTYLLNISKYKSGKKKGQYKYIKPYNLDWNAPR